jgi:hypothetical protein
MLNLFNYGNFVSYAGKDLSWKIQCDALTSQDWKCIAQLVANRYVFSEVVGIPRGGWKLMTALEKYKVGWTTLALIVDDVYTTGESMRQARKDIGGKCIGVVLFARGKVPRWINPIFTVGEDFR